MIADASSCSCAVVVGANFTAYQELKKLAHSYQPELKDLPSYQHMVIGLISGAMGPFSNAPIDTIKTRECTLHSLLHSDLTHIIEQDCKSPHMNRARRRSSVFRR